MVGLDDIHLYASSLSLDFRALLGVRKNVEESDWRNIGFHRRTVLPPWEDAVTLAVNAAKPLDTSKVGLLVVGTESAVDFGKPISSWVHGALNLPGDCRNFEVKHACYGGTAGLHTALDWLRANPEVDAIFGDYWDVYRLAFQAGRPVRGVPYPNY
ncbi:MAG: hypothetical protein ACK4YP_15890, partial [Myxococcota bacterium]